MPNQIKIVLIEIIWLIIAVILCALTGVWLFGNVFKETIDIHFYDSVFIASPILVLLPFFLLFVFLIFFFKELRNKFSKLFPNIVILIAGLFLIYLVHYVGKEFVRLSYMSRSSTVYPPLSGLGQENNGSPVKDKFLDGFLNALTVIQILITLVLLYVVFRWGYSKTNKKS
jgi:hypothetical protein